MSQKSSVMQLPQFVPKALTSDMDEKGILCLRYFIFLQVNLYPTESV